VRVEGSAVVDEAPAYHLRCFAVAAGREAFAVAGGGAGLAYLVEVRKEREDALTFAGEIDQRLGGA
jgi:hypothetical protein